MTADWQSVGKRAWLAMGAWRWLWLALILIGLLLTPIAGPSYSQWRPVPRDGGFDNDTAVLETRRSSTSPVLELRLSVPFAAGEYRVNQGRWVAFADSPVDFTLPAGGGPTVVVVCSIGDGRDCRRWRL